MERVVDPLKERLEQERQLPPRQLSDEERCLLQYILEHGPEKAHSFLPQVSGIQVVRWCTCGCPSISLLADAKVPPGLAEKEHILCDFEGRTEKGELIGLLLFQKKGKLTLLEAYSMDGKIQDPSGVFGWPTIESLKILEWEPVPGLPNSRRLKST